MRPVRLGVLGCADIAVRRILPAVVAGTALEFTAVAARDPGRAGVVATRFGGKRARSYEEVLHRADVDAVYIPLPPALHAEWIERALLAGKHVLAEKPLTTGAQETARLVTLAERSGLVLLENFMFLQHPAHEWVAALLRTGTLGRPRAFSSTFTIPPRATGDIRLAADLGGGALLDNGAYPVRAAQLLFGPDWTVRGTALLNDPTLGVDLGGSTLLSRPGGVTAQLTFGLSHGYTCRYEILCEHGRIALDRAFTPPADHRPELLVDRGGRIETITLEAADQVTRTLELFAAMVRGQSRPAGHARATVRQAELVDAVRAAAPAELDPASIGGGHREPHEREDF